MAESYRPSERAFDLNVIGTMKVLGRKPIKTFLPKIQPIHLEIAEKIQRITQFRFFNVEFIGETVIDVNSYPNPFCHPESVQWFIEGISTEL